MFFILSAFALGDDPKMISATPNKDTLTLYEIKYKDDKGEYHTTELGEGYYVGVRVYDSNGNPGELKYMNYNDHSGVWGMPLQVDGLEFTFRELEDRKAKKALKIEFHVSNTMNKPKKFDLGVFGDAALSDDDNSKLQFTDDQRGIIVTETSSNKQYTSLLKDSYYPNIDKIFIGKIQDSYDKTKPSTLPFFDNSPPSTSVSGVDSCFAFSWIGKEVPAKKPLTLGYLSHPGNSVPLAPFVKLAYEKKDYYPPNQDIPVTFDIIDHDRSSTLTIKYGLNGTEFTETVNGRSSNFVKNINLQNTIKYTVWLQAQDNTGYQSDNITAEFWAEGSIIPKFSLDYSKLYPQYNIGDSIELYAEVEDESEVTIFYQFDEQEIVKDDRVDTRADGWQKYHKSIPLSGRDLTLGDWHDLKIWAQDSFGLKSYPISSHRFFIIKPPNPEVHSVFFSRPRVLANQKIVIFGSATDPNVSQLVKVYATMNNVKTNIGNFTAMESDYAYAFWYTIPNIDIGYYNITVTAEDEEGLTSIKPFVKKIMVYDPAKPLPPEPLGNITVVPVAKDNNACFNLEFNNLDGMKYSMSYNNEGFYAGYRIWKDKKPSEIQLITHKQNSESEKDNVHFKFFHSYEPSTGYLELNFNVTNNDYFSQIIDLGVFVDSQFASDDGVKKRDDKRGFVIESENPNITYTVFTRDFGGMTNVDTTYLAPAARTSDEEMPIGLMPFFDNYETPANVGDTMYAFSWAKREIPAGESMIFNVILAPSANVRTPPTITDITPKYMNGEKYIFPETPFELEFKVVDFDILETIEIVLSINGKEKIIPFNITDTSNSYTYKETSHDTYGNKFHYKVYARDTSLSFISNIIDVTIPISIPPFVEIDPYLEFPDVVFTNQNITLEGDVSDGDSEEVFLMCRFDNGRVIELAKIKTEFDIFFGEYKGHFKVNIPIPEQIKPGMKHTLYYWAQDGSRTRYADPDTYEFKLKEYHPPKLLQAGLSRKSARQGDKILCFVVVDDNADPEGTIQVYVKFNKDKFEKVPNALFTRQEVGAEPYAFYWQVPWLTDPKVYDVQFMIMDGDKLASENKVTKTLVVIP